MTWSTLSASNGGYERKGMAGRTVSFRSRGVEPPIPRVRDGRPDRHGDPDGLIEEPQFRIVGGLDSIVYGSDIANADNFANQDK